MKQNLGLCLRSKLGDPSPEKNEVIMIRLQMIAATHAIQNHSIVSGVDEIRKDIEVYVQHLTVHAGHTCIHVCAPCARDTSLRLSSRDHEKDNETGSIRAIGPANQSMA